MVTTSDILTYIKEQAKFLGSVFLYTLVGGIVGTVAPAVIGFITGIPVVTLVTTNASVYSLPALGTTLGFATPFIYRMRAALKN